LKRIFMFRLAISLLGAMLAAAGIFAQTAPDAQAAGQIVGHVQNATTGDPVVGAQVQLVQFGRRSTRSAPAPRAVTSQPDGSFVFDGVPPGTYSLMASAPNFAVARYKAAGSSLMMDIFNLQPGSQMAGVVLSLQPYANLSGRVVDDTGQPVPHAGISAFVSVLMRGKTQLQPREVATSDDSGKFELKGVPNGKVYISASPAPPAETATPPTPAAAAPEQKLDLVTTFYPDSLNVIAAAPLDVASGQDQGGIEIHMKRAATFHIRGKIAVNAADGSKLVIGVSQSGSPASLSFGHSKPPGPGGQFDISGLVPGAYTLRLIDAGPATQHVLGRQDVTIAAADVNNVVITQMLPVTITLHARSESDEAADLSGVMVNLQPWDDLPRYGPPVVGVNPDGSRTITVLPGSYLIHVVGIPPESYISSLQFNQANALDKVIDVPQSGAGQIDVVFRKGLAQLDGTVAANGDSSPRSSTIVLVPENVAPDGSNLMMRGTGRGSNFSFFAVPPGRYTAFAVEQFDYNAWQNSDFITALAGRGAAVDLNENDHKRVELTAIPASDLLQVMAQLGLAE
jgi:hypothetical protein